MRVQDPVISWLICRVMGAVYTSDRFIRITLKGSLKREEHTTDYSMTTYILILMKLTILC